MGMSMTTMKIPDITRIKITPQLVEAILELHVTLPPRKIAMWLNAKNLNFGGVRPTTLFAMNRGHKVTEFIKNVRAGDIP